MKLSQIQYNKIILIITRFNTLTSLVLFRMQFFHIIQVPTFTFMVYERKRDNNQIPTYNICKRIRCVQEFLSSFTVCIKIVNKIRPNLKIITTVLYFRNHENDSTCISSG